MDSTIEFYENNGTEWSANRTDSFFHQTPFQKYISLLEPGDTVLDIGSANGIHVPLFLGIGHEVNYEGFDASKTLINIAQSRYPEHQFIHGNILRKATLPQRTYDGFWCAAVLMHIHPQDYSKMFENLEFISEPGAFGYITLPESKKEPTGDGDIRHFEFFTQDQFKKLIEPRGWKIIETGVLEGSPRNLWNWYIVQLP